jgi:hypothetical protein
MVTKEEAACKTSASVKLNGLLKFLEHSKFGGLTAFGTFKSCGGGYRVSHGSPLPMSAWERLLRWHQSIEPIEMSEYEILNFRRIGIFQNLHATNPWTGNLV